MKQSLEQMINLLREQKELLADMLELSHEMRATIVGVRDKKLDDLVRQERAALRKMNAIQSSVAELLTGLAAKLGLKGDVTVGGIVSRVPEAEGSAIKLLQEELKEMLYEFVELSGENQELIDAHFDNMDAVLNLIEGDDQLNNFYGGDGNYASEKASASGIFDNQA